jgi:BMFP domain-containing protein YqiC
MRGTSEVSTEYIWETFDGLFKTVHRQGRRVEELEARITDLERRLAERAGAVSPVQQQKQPQTALSEMPVERAA